MNLFKSRNERITAASVAVLILLWEAAALIAGSQHILPGPWQTIAATASLFTEAPFLKVVMMTLWRALIGFAAAFASALALGLAGGLRPGADAFMKPWIIVMRSTPVVAVILLALIWMGSDSVPVFIGFFTMFPVIYVNVVEGIRSVDPKIVQMAHLYRIDSHRLSRQVYIPAIKPFLGSALSTATGIGWRAIVVGEVLSQPQYGIGTVMHSAQTYLQVDLLLAWTLIAILVGAAIDRTIKRIFR